MARYVIHVCLLIAWCISIQRRLTNRQVRNLLIAVGILMAFWLTVRTVKYEWIADRTNPIGRYIWYSYYIPMVLIPLIGFFVVKYIDKPIDYDHPKWMNYLAIPAVLLLVLVFTNDLHQSVFRFHKGIELFDTQYQYGTPYYILMAWFILGGLYFVGMLLKKSRVPGNKHMQRLPLYIMLGAIVFWVLHTLKIINCDLTVMDCLLIVDEDFQPHYVSGGALPLSEADIAKTQTGAVHMENTLLRSTPIRAYRMGQTRDVLVYRLLADETIDERMLEILSAKQKEFDAFAEDSVIGDLQMQSDTSWLTKLVQEEQSRLGQQ